MNGTTPEQSPQYMLAGDIGGTNTSLALIKHDEEDSKRPFKLISRVVFESQKLSSVEEAISSALETFSDQHPGHGISAASISIAGPVENNRCIPTNIQWNLDGDKISEQFGFETLVINDFTAICYGIPLLDIHDPQEITPLHHPDGTLPPQSEYLPGIGVQAVVGAGTGLGVGYLLEERDRILALPAEAGHVDFAPFSSTTRELQAYMEKRNGNYPEPEMFVSGLGIPNIFRFLTEEKGEDSEILRQIAGLSDFEKPPAISKNADNDPVCRRVLELFVEMYARVAHNLALSYIPKKGLFLAGGIAAKNKRFFLEDDRFIKTFLHNFQPTIRPVLKQIPIYIVEDYRISLYGAAHAFVQIQKFI